MKRIKTVVLAAGVAALACGGSDDPAAPGATLSGKVTNQTAATGPLIVEIDPRRRDVADSAGRYEIMVADDFYVDSLYAWVDVNQDGRVSAMEPFGFYHSADNPTRAKAFQVRGSNVTNLNFDVK